MPVLVSEHWTTALMVQRSFPTVAGFLSTARHNWHCCSVPNNTIQIMSTGPDPTKNKFRTTFAFVEFELSYQLKIVS